MRRYADEESGRQQPGWAGATVAFTLGASAGTSGGCALLKAACGYGIVRNLGRRRDLRARQG
jgi:hypothetical protein